MTAYSSKDLARALESVPTQERITDPAARKLLDSPLSQDEVVSIMKQFQAGHISSEEADKLLGIKQDQPKTAGPSQPPTVEVAPGKLRPRQPWEF